MAKRRIRELFRDALENTVVKSHFCWKIALCQHPMYQLIDEDRGIPVVGERVPPWGAPDAAEYVQRVLRNLSSLEKFPDLRLDYEFSGVEMESMARDFPYVIEKMKELRRRGVLEFLDGSFSQAHLQVFGSESSWRQFEMGLEVFEKLFGEKVVVYACQETGLHQQVPQILKKLGYKFIVLPVFPWAMEITDGKPEMTGCYRGVSTVEGDEFIEAVALDGTSLPLYAKVTDVHEGIKSPSIVEEITKDLYSGAPVWTWFPDMIEVDEKIHEEISQIYDFALLGEALSNRFKEVSMRSKARIYTYWSYIEGVWADELLRRNKLAEETATLAESIQCMARLAGVSCDKRDEIKKMWHTILKYQHHDVYWIEVTDLRRKAINLLQEAMNDGRRITDDIAGELVEEDRGSIAIFNALPESRRCLIETTEETVPGDGGAFQKYGQRYFGFLELPALGFKSFVVSKERSFTSKEIPLPKEITTRKNRIEFFDQGLIKQIATTTGEELLKTDQYMGGEIKCMMGNDWVNNRKADCCFYEGEVSYVLERTTSLGEIPLKETYFFFKNEPVIKVEVEFYFHGNEVGNYWLDETKINTYYPTRGSDIYHDIPFGYVQGRERRPLFAINWIYCGGLIFINRGNVKHWVRDGVIANMIAWGGNLFDNRMHFGWTQRRQYDLRLYGKQRIEYFILPFCEFDGNNIVTYVNTLTFPVFITKGKGERSFYKQKHKYLYVTSLCDEDDGVFARGYKLPSKIETKFLDWEILNIPLSEL